MNSIKTISLAPAPFCISAEDMHHYMLASFSDKQVARKIGYLFRENSIDEKYSVLPDFSSHSKNESFFGNSVSPTTAQRLAIYRIEALKLAKSAAQDAINKSSTAPSTITDIITVSCTGMHAPGLETELAQELELNAGVNRHAINFMGCYAAFHAFRLADLICTSNPNAQVLLVCVELSTLHFRKDLSDDNLLATYLFGDGAAACIISASLTPHYPSIELHSFHSALIPQGAKDMTWSIGESGFEMVLNRSIPKHIRNHIAVAFTDAIQKAAVSNNDIEHYAIHPGGKNILKAFEDALDIDINYLKSSYKVLKSFGNMSSVTILFVLNEYLSNTFSNGWMYAAAFGPGLSVESGVFKLNRNV